jgi:hypothetical protein
LSGDATAAAQRANGQTWSALVGDLGKIAAGAVEQHAERKRQQQSEEILEILEAQQEILPDPEDGQKVIARTVLRLPQRS